MTKQKKFITCDGNQAAAHISPPPVRTTRKGTALPGSARCPAVRCATTPARIWT